ncbi:hypothetical protein TL16_g05839 [Triparma laevis f. inornata]|uniref:Uncharacterized protein n=1 Tax=Triparma laevis f. inornata TaxID=1714386 RepID=A0A9W7AJQ5_9STRA|nr:hypothetical protein TL16_g05839 [Triparma laevis f. inornata]
MPLSGNSTSSKRYGQPISHILSQARAAILEDGGGGRPCTPRMGDGGGEDDEFRLDWGKNTMKQAAKGASPSWKSHAMLRTKPPSSKVGMGVSDEQKENTTNGSGGVGGVVGNNTNNNSSSSSGRNPNNNNYEGEVRRPGAPAQNMSHQSSPTIRRTQPAKEVDSPGGSVVPPSPSDVSGLDVSGLDVSGLDDSRCDTSGFGTDDDDEDDGGIWSLQMEQAMSGLNEMCYNLNDDFSSSGPHPQHSEQEEMLEKGRQEMEIVLTEAINMASLEVLPNTAVSQRKRCLHASQNVLNLSLNLCVPSSSGGGSSGEKDKDKGEEQKRPALAQPQLTMTSIAAILHLTLPMMATTRSWLALPFLVKACKSLQHLPLSQAANIHKHLSSPLCALFNLYSVSPSLTDTHLQCLTSATIFLKSLASKETVSTLFKTNHINKPVKTSIGDALCKAMLKAVESHNAQVIGYDGTEFLCSALNVFRMSVGCSDKSVKSAMLKLKLPTVICGVLKGLPDRDDIVGVDSCAGTNEDVAMPVARTLGRLSLQEPMRNCLNSDPHCVRDILRLLVYFGDQAVMSQYAKAGQEKSTRVQCNQLNITLRAAFTLGNLTASNDSNRRLVTCRFGGGKTLPACSSGIAATYMKEALEPESPTAATLVDALVKITRLVANLCINREAGMMIAAASGIDALSSLLMVSIEVDEQDLMLNVVSAITNLSFYGRMGGGRVAGEEDVGGVDGEVDGVYCRSKIFSRREEICSCLVGVLLHDNQLAVVEAARAFGNFSRDEMVRSVICSARGDEAMAMLLGNPGISDEIMFAIIGCLINLAASPKHNRILTGADGCKSYETVDKLVRALRRFGLKRVGLSAVVCKVLYNLSYGCGGGGEAFANCFETAGGDTVETIGLLRNTLLELLDVCEDARAEETEEHKSAGEEVGAGAKAKAGRYDEFIATGSALLKVVKDTWEFVGGVEEEEEEEEEAKYDELPYDDDGDGDGEEKNDGGAAERFQHK